ncbi:MAG: MBL fold metallo-hydrolase [Lachnospiraceae bacterium]|nr:MBL fold metallo-hydrolase [Lachnospiraceae bacterium]
MAEVIKINDNTWRIEDEFVRFFLLCGTKKAVMIDSGVNCPEARKIAEELTNLPIMLLNTHGDGDHVSGTGAFEEIYMAADDYNNCMLKDRFPNTTLVPVKDSDTFDLGNRTLEIIAIPGHTFGSIAILDVENRILFSGDSVQDTHIYLFGDKRSPKGFSSALNKLISISDRFDYIYPSHGTPILDSDYCDKVLESWNKVLDGKIEAKIINLFGTDVKQFDGEFCGFYCD